MVRLSALPTRREPADDLLTRPDVVLDRGLLHLVHDDVPGWRARIDDLLAVADAFDAADVPLLLIRRDRSTPAIVVDLDRREDAFAALRSLAHDPFYVKGKRRPPVLAADAAPLSSDPFAVRVYRPRITPRRTLRYGASLAARVEFWRFGEVLVEAPDENVLMRRQTPAEDVGFTTVEQHGRVWRTIEGMFDPLPKEFRGDVDIVFSWVDGSTSEFQRQRAAALAEYVVGEGDDSPARYRHVDELRYALRSVYMYAPWVRRIHIATDSPVPGWLTEHPRIRIVRSEEFFADPSTLPTHNSHAVEAQLHRIPGIAEHFLYSNDDMFFGRPVEPELFFTPAGVTKFVESGVRIGTGEPAAHRSGHDNALRVNRALLRERFGRTITRDLEHCAAPLRRSVLAELEREFAEDFARTAATRFRSATDISVTNSLYHYYALMTGRAVATTQPRVQYVQTTTTGQLRKMERLAERRDIDMFCLNDGGTEQDVPEELRVRALRAVLDRMFPVRAPWERADLSAGRESARSAHPSTRG
ncbi:stealth conserved region 3 domain-containing protein [Microbacterium immunditiarum]|uniref:UDP-glucose 4-epimerase n=1 Tax=Microbacterium immunditiarum TaxID=337480 RepID=A0A7Y9GNS8_9MICO|nr:stealth conserved region 3 domain-containing protein [Microbacterium immunditiarum]NYE19767.1 UDP-glucose 4-epimerase [Microbacterium immunditiarum]